MAASVSSQPRQEAAFRREGLALPRSASSDNAEITLPARSGLSLGPDAQFRTTGDEVELPSLGGENQRRPSLRIVDVHDFDARKHAAWRERQLVSVTYRRNRPLTAERDFLIERLLCSSHRPFAGIKTKIDRRRNQSFACAPGKAPTHRQLAKNATASSRPVPALRPAASNACFMLQSCHPRLPPTFTRRASAAADCKVFRHPAAESAC
jgi:hypothetical protein